MFEAEQRQNFLTLLRPPTGYRLEAAVGTTFSLDFVALTSALLAMIDTQPDEDSAKPIESLHAMTRLARRVQIFVNRGQVQGPQQVSRLTVLYDRIVHEIRVPDGSFHPKVWVTYYRPRSIAGGGHRPEIVRVICASRNLTTSQCWEAFVSFEGEVGKSKVSGELNKGIVDFLRKLAAATPFHSSLLTRVNEALARARFALGRPFQAEAKFLWQWHNSPALLQCLPTTGQRALIVSPFVRKTFLEGVLGRFEQTILISTQHELDALQGDDFIERLCGGKNRVFVVEPVDTDSGETAMDLHAKLMVFDDPTRTTTFLGSANASVSAWSGTNCEAVLRFSPGVSVDHFCDRFVYDEGSAKNGERRLRGWISKYRRQAKDDSPEERAERELSEVCASICQLTLVASYDAGSNEIRLGIETVPSDVESAIGESAAVFEIRIGLLSQLHSDAALKPFSALFQGGLVFAGVAVADLTEFVVVDVTHREFGISRRFMLKAKADFTAWRDERDTKLLQQLLTRESLQTFLRAILFDAATRPLSTRSNRPVIGGGEPVTWSLLSELTIEDVIRACTEDSSRIEEINRVLKAFENTEWIDEEFRSFWKAFVSAESLARGEALNA